MKKVRIQAVNEKYKDASCPIAAEWNGSKWLTGQEDMSPEELKHEPYIIDPDVQEVVNHNMTLNVRTEKGEKYTKDDVLYKFFSNSSLIATKKALVNKSEHLFVMIDSQVEATDEISISDLKFNAHQKARTNMTIKSMKDLGIFLGLSVKEQPHNVIQARVYEACDTRPADIIAFYDESSQDELFVRKLIFYGLIQKKEQGKFYTRDGAFVGSNIRDARDFVNNDKYSDQVSVLSQRLVELDEPEIASQMNQRPKSNPGNKDKE